MTLPLPAAPPARLEVGRKLLTLMLWLVLGVLGLGLPAAYFAIGHGALAAALQTKAEVKAEVVTQLIGRSPQTWRFEEPRLTELIQRLPVALEGEQAAVLDEQGEVLARSAQAVAAPSLSRSAPLFDAGSPVGRVEVSASLRELCLQTLGVALLGALLAALVHGLTRHLQRRARRIADAMFDQHERARVTLHSIGDAVVTTDATLRVDYLNPVAERLTQWPLAEALGRTLDEICVLVDERSQHQMPSLMPRALQEGRVCPFTGKDVALRRRDGTLLSIEDSAAPIRNHAGEVIGGVMVFRDVTATRRMAQRISWAATHDPLTGLANRREFEAKVDAALLSARKQGRQHVVCYMDLDQFKLVNDSSGHQAGDALLKQLAELLRGRLRESDTLARLGGDEFGALLEGCGMDRARLIAAEMLAAVRAHRFSWEGRVYSVGISIGLAPLGPDTGSRTELFSAADTACYMAKEQGRNRVCVYQSSDAEMARRSSDMGWAARLGGALEQGRFLLYYQPYLPLAAGASGGRHVEILLRLIDEQGRVVLPAAFLPAAERYNIMPGIDRWMLATVFERYHELAATLGAPLCCAVNIAASTLNAEGTLDYIRELAARHPLPPGAICFELSESAALAYLRSASQFMLAVKALGFSVALDDFGVGTNSLSVLKGLPIDYLKIDGSFVRNITQDAVDREMTESINRVGHLMGVRTVAEDAESQGVIEALRGMGVDYAQGFGFAEPAELPLQPRGEEPR